MAPSATSNFFKTHPGNFTSISQTVLVQISLIGQLERICTQRCSFWPPQTMLLATTACVHKNMVCRLCRSSRKGQRHDSVYVLASLRESFPTFLLQFLYQAWQLQKKLQCSPAWRYFWSQLLVWTNIQVIKKTYCGTEINISSLTLVKAGRLQVNESFRTDPIRVQTFPGINKPCAENPNV